MKLPNPTIKKMHYPNGNPYWQVSCSVEGKRYRRKHGSEEAANQDSVRLMRTSLSGLTPSEHVATEQAIQILKKSDNPDVQNVDLVFAAQWFCEHYVNPARLKTIRQYYLDFMEIKKAQGRRTETLNELRRTLVKFMHDFEQANVTLLKYEDIEPWIISHSTGPASRKRISHIIKHFFDYLAGVSKNTPNPHPILKGSPFFGRSIIFQDDETQDDSGVVIFSAKECEQLLHEAQKHNAQRMLVWLLFTGMRPYESTRFWGEERWGWNMISDDPKYIRVPKAVSKTRRMRMIEVSPTLREWLMVYRNHPTFMTKSWELKYRIFRKEVLPPEKLKKDVPRHTLISMMIKDGKNWAEIELQMGNKKHVQMRHYASLVISKNESDYFYGLTPDKFPHDMSEDDLRKKMKARQSAGLRSYLAKKSALKQAQPVQGAA